MDRSRLLTVISEVSEARILNHIHALEGEKHPESSPDALRATVDYLADQMRSAGLAPTRQAIDTEAFALFPNVIGRLAEKFSTPGSSEKERLVIGAHYDTVASSPGADDNASGLAVLLEVARVVSGRTLPGIVGKRVPEFVAFSMEEAGFIGSDYYVQEAEGSGAPLWGAIILECVGYTDRRPGSQQVPPGFPIRLPDKGDFIGLVGNARAAPIQAAFESAAKEAAPTLSYIGLLVPGGGEAVPDTRRSDHVPFWDRGHRAVMLTDTANFRNPNYHRESDRLETLDIAFVSDVARALAATVIDLCGLEIVSR